MGVNGEEDRPVWIWSKNGKYNVKSMYNLLANQGPVRSFHHLWLIWHNAIATKDNMFRRKWRGDITYRFCPNNETIHHLFFTCDSAKYTWGIVGVAIGAGTRPSSFSQYLHWISSHLRLSCNLHIVGLAGICWAIWKLRNRACFEHRLIRSPAALICYACAFLKYWAVLQTGGDGDALREGARILQEEALRQHPGQVAVRKRLTSIMDDGEEADRKSVV